MVDGALRPAAALTSGRVVAWRVGSGGRIGLFGTRAFLAAAQVGPQLRGQSRGTFVPIGHREYALPTPNGLDNRSPVRS